MRKNCLSLLAFSLLMGAANGQAQTPMNVVTQAPLESKKADVTITALEWMDKNKMDKQVTKVSDLVQTKLGVSLRKDMSDLAALQRLIDQSLVKQEDTDTQQAMGVVLGNVMLADFPQTLEWKIYRDELGRSRALCAKGTQECLFPVTMLSRRMEVGSRPDVKKIYQDAINLMADYLPKMPYGGEILHRLPQQ